MNYLDKYNEWKNHPNLDAGDREELVAIESDDKEIKERFLYDLEFGTGGLRGILGIGTNRINKYMIRKTTQGFAEYIKKAGAEACTRGVVIAHDNRRFSIEFCLETAGVLAANGIKAYVFESLRPTPELSFAVRELSAFGGVMITASHNPYYDNGIKIINRFGEKLDNSTAALIEAYLDGNLDLLGVKEKDLPVARREKLGGIIDYVAGRNRYMGYLISVAAHSYKNLRIGLDCANGAAWNIAKSIFEALGAQVYLTGASPDGLNINRDCGSTHIENLQKLVSEQHLDAGFAFDGDADRCIAIDEQGTIVDGDTMLFILATRLKQRGMLDQDTVVATIMSNTGLERALKKEGIQCIRTNVGDRFIYEAMQKGGYRLGGEQSGHIILRKYATTGDGLLTAIMIAEQMLDEKLPLSALAKPVVYLPQLEKNIPADDKSAVVANPQVQQKLQEIKDRLGSDGRILLRESGTEPMVRIMVEAETKELCQATVAELVNVIQSL